MSAFHDFEYVELLRLRKQAEALGAEHLIDRVNGLNLALHERHRLEIGNLHAALMRTGRALANADLYLDGFVWATEPEMSELARIKRASKRAQELCATFANPLRAAAGAVPEGDTK